MGRRDLFVYKRLLCAVLLLCASSGNEARNTVGPALQVVELRSSRFVAGEVVHTFEEGGGNYVLQVGPQCPNGTFTLDRTSGQLIVGNTINFSPESLQPQCLQTASGTQAVIRTFFCSVIASFTLGIAVVINVIADLPSLSLAFTSQHYAGAVLEGVGNASVNGLVGLRPLVLPVDGLTVPQYRLLGSGAASFYVSTRRHGCLAFPLIFSSLALDREQQSSHELTLEAFTASASANTTITVSVLDANDHAPQFSNSPLLPKVEEGQPLGSDLTTFHAIDSDAGLNTRLWYSLATPSTHFSINPFAGSLYLYSPVDHEMEDNFHLTVKASDLGRPQLSATANISIFIADTNELPPAIHPLGDGPLAVSELASAGESVVTVMVTDGDSTGVTLELTSFDCSDCFTVASPLSTAEGGLTFRVSVVAGAVLDYESFPSGYTVTLTATDNGDPPLSNSLELTIPIVDANEPPAFLQAHYAASVTEGVPLGTEVIRLQASDPDTLTANGELRYSLSGSDPNRVWFSINENVGVVSTAAAVDHEMASSVSLTVTAVDRAGEEASTVVVVTIMDLNENQPSFSMLKFSTTVSETHPTTESIFDFSATDVDGGCNGAVSYNILFAEPDVFRLDSFSGLLYPKNNSALDYEAFQSARVAVRATNLGLGPGAGIADAILNVTLTDKNDTPPTLDPFQCSCWVQEGIATATCPPPSAHDPDSSSISFRIISGNEQRRFRISNPATGVVSLTSALQYEERNEYSLELVASDGLLESLPQRLTVVVLDEDDSAPVYASGFSFVIPVNERRGALVANLAAEHADAGYNALTSYSFASSTPATVTSQFRLDPLSGLLYARVSPLTSAAHTFRVDATALPPSTGQASVDVTVTVQGSRNNPPRFALAVERLAIPENLNLNDEVFNFEADDSDAGDNGVLNYSLLSEGFPSSSFFTLTSSGQLTLAQQLDGMAGYELELVVMATDGGSPPLSATQQLVISVYPMAITMATETLVHNPGVGVRHSTGSVLEATDIRVLVASLPAMEGLTAITYSILDENFRDMFRVEANNVYTESGFGSALHRSVAEALHLTLRAQYESNFHYTSLTVTIQDINDQAPEFTKASYMVDNVYIVTPTGAYVFQVEAVDSDVGSNSETEYSLVSPAGAPFAVDSDLGFIEVTGALTATNYQIFVKAADKLMPTLSSTATVSINVLESSNSLPVLTGPSSTISIPETTAVNFSLFTVTVADPDPGLHGMNTFCISSGNEYSLFSVDSTGQVRVAQPLDYEAYPSTFQLEIAAFDLSPNTRTSTTTVTVSVTDKNDEAPVFLAAAYKATIVEAAPEETHVLTVTATDRDAGPSGQIRYSLQGTDGRFTVDEVTGAITTTSSPTNREAQFSFSLTLTATDQASEGSRLSSSVLVSVTVLDINDNIPRFLVGSTTRQLPETAPVGVLVYQLESEDRDEGLNGAVVYAITSGNENHTFSLDPWSGSVTLARPVDFEAGPQSYELSFSAADLGSPAHTATAELTLTVQLEEANEHAPQFNQTTYTCTITEGATKFDPPCGVAASDADSTGSAVQYTIARGNERGVFTVSSTSGQLGTASTPDWEEQSSYVLSLQAEDSGVPRRSSTALVFVNVLNVDEHLPLFDPASAPLPVSVRNSLDTISVPETLPPNTLLFYVHASDQDGDISGYALQQPSTLFSVDTHTGAVFLVGELDYETSENHDLLVVATSSTGSENTFLYTINVLNVDENMYPPEFPPDTPLTVSISRTAALSTHLTTLTAVDRDKEREGTGGKGVSYYITGGSGYGYFEIDVSGGNISTSYTLSGVEGDELCLLITAVDRGSLSSSHELLVLLLGDTHAVPEFISPMMVASAPEGFGGDVVGVVVMILQALVNGYVDSSICYFITGGNKDGKFAVNASTGVVAVAASLDRELVSSYSLTVQATQAGAEENATALLLINVADTNDQRPAFQPVFDEDFTASIFSSHPVDPAVPLMRVFAVDGDSGMNSDLSYTLEPESSPFAISNNGDIYLTMSLDAGTTHDITVVATDNGLSPLSSQTVIQVRVLEVPAGNPQTPAFSQQTVSLNVSEDTAPGTLIHTASASDTDPVLHYRLVNPPPQFAILPNSGQLYLTKKLDREEETSFAFMMEVSDGSSTDTIPVAITVGDVNDERPSFLRDYFFTVTEHTNVPSVAGTVQASDGDKGANSDISYSIVDSTPSASHALFLMSSGGVLSVVGDLDREIQPVHVLTIAAHDGGSPSLVTYGRITITVEDINDHRPSFRSPFQGISISDNTVISAILFTFAAFDPDNSTNSEIHFSLSTPGTPFLVNSSSGELSISSPLSTIEQFAYSLTISAFEPDSPSSTAELTFDLTVFPGASSTPHLSVSVSGTVLENQPLHTAVSQITTSDPTKPVAYSIIDGNELGHFVIETFTGIVRTGAILDREETSVYSLTVQGSYLQGGAANITLAVSVLDENDNPPSFSSRNLSFTITENTSPSLSLGVVDRDSGINAQVQTYFIPDSAAAARFSIDSSGSLTPLRPLDRESDPTRLSFEVYAVDSGTPPLFSKVHVTVEVEDTNDNMPEFSLSEYHLLLSTPALVGATVSSISAQDDDEGTYGSIQYNIGGGNGSDFFIINQQTGEIVVSNNYRLEGDYFLEVSATDGGGMVGVADVYIHTRGCGFQSLLLEPRFISLEIPENTSADNFVFQPMVLDFGMGADLEFFLTFPSPYFSLVGSGVLRIANVLDHESIPMIPISIQARSRTDPGRIAQSDIEVIVTDVNDNPPIFLGTPYEWSVSSDVTPGSAVDNVTAIDADIGAIAKITFSVVRDPTNSFSVEANTGVVMVTRTLTASGIGSIVVIEVEARDGGVPFMATSVNISIHIVDSNAPQFLSSLYTASVNESASRGTIVATVMASGSELTYHIVSTEPQFPFNIFAGKVTVNDFGLDYESQQFYQIDLMVIDGANGLTGRARLDVTILDVNDEVPQFTSGGVYFVTIEENIAIGTSVISVNASDDDSPANAAITYHLQEDGAGLFEVDQSTGLITTAGAIDYETNPQFELTVLAVDSGTPALTGDAVVTVQVMNLNDNKPQLSQQIFFGFLPAQIQPGDDVATVIASDDDGDTLIYEIVGGSGLFEVDSSGVVTVATSAMRTEFIYVLNVSVSDGVSVVYATVQIEVEHVNSHSPVFNSSLYTASLVENSPADEHVLQVFATDDDAGTNAEITYSLSVLSFQNNPPLKINPRTGVITTTATPADREQHPMLSVIVFATDGPGRTGTSDVRITLLDINDNAPVFSQLTYIGSILTSAAQGTPVLTVTAVDRDIENNGKVAYGLVATSDTESPNFPFRINADSGVVSTAFSPLVSGKHNFSVTASDGGSSPMTAPSPALVEIIINQDSATLPPAFSEDSYSVHITEGFYPPRDIFTVSASAPACSNNILYSIVVPMSSEIFRINNPVGGVISYRGGFLDHEDVPEYMLTIQATCTPNSGDNLFSFVQVTVIVDNINEEPSFSTLIYNGQTPEDAVTNSPVIGFAVMATDPEMDKVSYRVTDLMGAPFYINENNGIVHTSGPLDRESISSYQFQVQAFDDGSPPLNSTNVAVVRVTVTDVNDSPPEFNQTSYHLELAENSEPGTIVFGAANVVSDNDTVENSIFSYFLQTSEGRMDFAVNVTTGEVRLVRDLDRESIPSYKLELRAFDGVNSGTAVLSIEVIDVNDQTPMFNSSNYTITLMENYPTNQPFLQVFALDMDQGIYGEVTYSILPTGQLSQEVAINATTGEVSFLVSPDFDTNQRIELQVQASDIGQLMSRAALIIILVDLNDNSPEFTTEGGYTAGIHENRINGTHVTLIDATDRDSGANGLVTYALHGPASSYFLINTHTGVVSTNASFDREKTSSFDLVVIAMDSGDPQLSTNTTLTIIVLDENDESPTFTMATYIANVSESQSSGFSFLTVQAEDADDGLNSDVFYRLLGENNDYFSLTENPDGTAAISLARDLNYEAIRSYNLSLRAFDRGIPTMEGRAFLIVNVIDENDNPPQFSLLIYSAMLEENVEIGSTVTTVMATDLDESDILVYSIENAASVPQFTVNSSTGVITTTQHLDYEEEQSYTFTVMVQDQTAMPFSASATVEVTVMDVNDNPPCFTNLDNETITIVENTGPRLIRTLQVDDPDSAAVNGLQPTYQIEFGNEANLFRLTPTAGQLSILQPPDREEQSHYDLVITANDNGNPDLTCVVILTVLIGDENDNPPETGHQDIYVYVRAGKALMLQGTALGMVFVNDPDIVNNYTFQLSTNSDDFAVGSDGTITLVQPPAPGTYNFQVMVMDPPHTVTSDISLQWIELSERAIENSFSMQLEGVTAENFVIDNLMNFIEVVSETLSNDPEITPASLHVFSIQPALDGSGRVDLAITAEASGGSTFPPALLQHVIHLHRADIEASLSLSIHTEHIDPCALNECPQGIACSSPQTFTTAPQSLGSSFSVLYLGLARGQELTCNLPFSPCASLSTCTGASTCSEKGGAATCYDDCSPNPCQNGGICTAQNPGYYCHCPSGLDGRNCELTVGSFSGESYAIFPSLTQRPNGSITLEFSTAERSGLLLYTGRFDEDTLDFLLLELIDGLASLRVSYGGELYVLSASVEGELSDRQWHSLHVQYAATEISLTVTTLTPYTKHSSTERITGSFYSLDLGAPVILGGFSPELDASYNYQHPGTLPSFTGCLRNVVVGGKLLDFSSPLVQSQVGRGCGDRCTPNPCSNGGSCIEALDPEAPLCNCPPDYQGPRCAEDSIASTFSGQGYIQYELRPAITLSTVRQQGGTALLRSGQTVVSLGFVISKEDMSSTLLHLGSPDQLIEFVSLELDSGYLQLRYDLGSGPAIARLGGSKVDVAKSHTVSIHRTGRTTELVLDDTFLAVATSSGTEESLEFEVSDIYVGGLPGRPSTAFSGCIWGVKLGHRDLPPSGENNYFNAKPEGKIDSICRLRPQYLSEVGRAIKPLHVYTLIGGILIALITIATVLVVSCFVLQRHLRGKKQKTFNIDHEGREREQSRVSGSSWQRVGGINLRRFSRQSRRTSSDDEDADDFVLRALNSGHRPEVSPTPYSLPLRETELSGPAPHSQTQPPNTTISPRIMPSSPPAYQDHFGLHLQNTGYLLDSPERNLASGSRQVDILSSTTAPLSPPPRSTSSTISPPPPPPRHPSQPSPLSPPPKPTSPHVPVFSPPPYAPTSPASAVFIPSLSHSPLPPPRNRLPTSGPPSPPPPAPPRPPSPPHTVTSPPPLAGVQPRSPPVQPSSDMELSEVLSLGDVEVKKSIIEMRVREANVKIERLNFDLMQHYKEEGRFELLGSLGSLYDIIIEAEHDAFLEDYDLSIRSQAPSLAAKTTPSKVKEQPSEPREPPILVTSERSQKRSVPPVNSSYLHQPQSPLASSPPPITPASSNWSMTPNVSSAVQHAHEGSHDSSLYHGNFDKKLDNLVERFHQLSSDPPAEAGERIRLI